MKKIVSMLAAAGLGLTLLAGCQSAAPTAADERPAENTSVTDTDAAETTADDEAAGTDVADAETAVADAETDVADAVQEYDFEIDTLTKEVVDYTKAIPVWNCPMTGFTFELPESFSELKGQVFTDEIGEIDIGAGVFHARLFYVPATDEEREALKEALSSYDPGNDPDGSKLAAVAAAEEKFHARGYMPFFDIIAFKDGITLDEAMAEAWISSDTNGSSVEIGKSGDYTYYYLTRDYTSMAPAINGSFTDEYYDEFMGLVEDAENIASHITITAPTPLKGTAEEGTAISFVTTDLDGNTVKSEDIFSGHKVTMINIWATWCGPCKDEMPELEKLNKEFADKGCQIIGICYDTMEDSGAIAEAKEILKEYGVTYLNLVETEEMSELLPTTAFPISYFVDSEGNTLGHPLVGAQLPEYSSMIDYALKLAE